MLHITLLILKIIGIVLLCVVGILLLTIVCVLFVPVRYRIRLAREEGEDKPPVVVYVKVIWLLHLVNVLVRYPAEPVVRIRILIFTLFRIPQKEKKPGKRTDKGKKKKRTDETEQAISEERKVPESSVITTEGKLAEGNGEDFGQRSLNLEESREKEFLFRKIRQIFIKIKQIVKKIKSFFKNIQYTIRRFCDKIKNVSDNIQYYREALESAPFRQSAELCKKELGWVLKKLKPDRFEADFIVGMEDPATTGEILAICGMLYPLIGQYVRVVGDFDCGKTHVEGQLYIRGRVKMITFLRTVVRIYFNKDIKKLIKLLKKEDV